MQTPRVQRGRWLLPLLSSLLAATAASADDDIIELERLTITGNAEERESTPGSVTHVDEEELEVFSYNDIHQVLDTVPGVYIRQEDGWGLRPNIGMRGADSDRSKKIALAEDGILLAPAPYSAPAAYYFPMLARIQAVEVFKGPAAIQNGPNTVGGVVNLVSRVIPGSEDEEDHIGAVDLGLGSFGTAKAHAYGGFSNDTVGAMLEGVYYRSDGFHELKNGGDTGFDKRDVVAKLRWNSPLEAENYHQIDLKIGYSDEDSDQSYLGLTDADFRDEPERRYTAAERDRMVWDHQHFSLNHYFDPGGDFTIDTTLYERRFARVWDKLNGFADGAPSLQDIFANPDSSINSIFLDVLRGDRDSSTNSETLLAGENDRDFVSRGIQTTLAYEGFFLDSSHQVDVGLRVHQDEITRRHTEHGYLMQNGGLVDNGDPWRPTTRNEARSIATALYVHDRIESGKWTVSGGFRAEFIDNEFDDFLSGESKSRDQDVLIPGIGINYRLLPKLNLLFGVHKGFVPASPESDDAVDPEESINYEAGLRYSGARYKGEFIGFFNDYSNLSGTCTFSSGCATTDLDSSFNAGSVHIYGLESSVGALFSFGGEASPTTVNTDLAYTYTGSEIRNDFTSPRPDLQDVVKGDELPYLPEHQMAARVTLQRFNLQTSLAWKYMASMRTIAGQGSPPASDSTDAYSMVDLSLRYQWRENQQVYFLADNLFDTQKISARRPYGARGVKPQTFTLGFKLDF